MEDGEGLGKMVKSCKSLAGGQVIFGEVLARQETDEKGDEEWNRGLIFGGPTSRHLMCTLT